MMIRQTTPPWAGFRHLIWPAIRSLINQSKHGQRMERLRLTFFGILGISFMVLTGLGAHWLFSQFLQAEFFSRTLDPKNSRYHPAVFFRTASVLEFDRRI